jgi:ribonucleoside-diphosphate reductase alpha chain
MAALTSASLGSKHFEYTDLAGRITISNLQKQVPYDLDAYVESVGDHLAPETRDIISLYRTKFDEMIQPERDFLISFFGCKTLQKAYLLKDSKQNICEPIQYMWLRVAIGIHGDDFESIQETYRVMSTLQCTHATPTLFHAGSKHPQLLSCFLLGIEDSVTGIYKAITDCAHISKWGGGIGVWAQGIRSNGSRIRGTNGITSGIVPMLKVFNDTARYINQSGKRNGSFAMYLEPWHADVLDFLEAKKNHGDENARARDLFYAMWIPDLFMKKVLKNEDFCLFCPDECPGLADTWGDEFETLYHQYESEGRQKKTVKAREVWNAIITSQIETGTPYILYKDAANRKSNQQNLGTIRSSNLCTEIIEYSDSKEYACCTLASIALPRMIDPNGTYNFQQLGDVTRILVRNLNKVIDRNYYPVPETQLSNSKHRPIGIGVQGLADVYAQLRLPFHSEQASKLN